LARVQRGSPEDIDLAVHAAREAFDKGPWGNMGPTQRAKCIYKLSDLIDQHRDELAGLDAVNNGKPYEICKVADLYLLPRVFRYYAGWCDKVTGRTIPLDGPFHLSTRREPVGVVGQVIPWNFPLLMAGWKLAPALAAGCTVVLKSA